MQRWAIFSLTWGAFTCWFSISCSMVAMAPVATTWVGFVHASQIGWTRPTLAALLLDANCRKNRGIAHDTTGQLLCPAEFDWDNLVWVIDHSAQPNDLISIRSIRAKLRAFDEDFDWLSSYHSRCFYTNYKPDMTQLESGYLKSTLLIKVRCFSLFVFHTYCFRRSIKVYLHRPLQQRIF